MRKGLGFFLAVTTAAANWLIWYKVGTLLHIPEPAILSTVFMLSLIFHELGHMIAFRIHGIRTYILFCVLGAVTVPLKEDREKWPALDPAPQMAIALAGVIGNFIFVSLASLFFFLRVIDHTLLAAILFTNGLLVFTNLVPPPLPLITHDGDIFMEEFLRGVRKKSILPHTLVLSIALVALAAGSLLFFGPGVRWIIPTLLGLWLMRTRARSLRRHQLYAHYPEWHLERRLVEPKAQKRWMALYLFLVFAGLASIIIAFRAMP